MRIYVNVINKSETVPQHRQLYTISFSDTLPLTSTRSGTKLSLRLSARLSKYRRSQIVLERYVKLSMLCTFILHLIFFLFLILYPQHTPRLWEEMVVFLSYFLLHLFLFWGGWDFVFLILYPQHTPRLWEVFYAFPYSLASYTMLPSHIVIITLPFSLLPSQRLFDDLLLVFSYVQYLLGSNTTTSATPSSFTAPPSKL